VEKISALRQEKPMNSGIIRRLIAKKYKMEKTPFLIKDEELLHQNNPIKQPKILVH
jgi:hypothetical protein